MADYDLNNDIPSGLASADFPISAYDRPQLAFSNLLRGNIDGMTRAMLSPDTLSPNQLKSVTDILTKGKKQNPFIKTILDIATNPVVILGLIAGLKYPMGSTQVLLDIRKGLLPKAAAMSKLAGFTHGAMQKLRTIPGAFEALWDTSKGASDFAIHHGGKLNTALTSGGSLSKAEGVLISMRLDGLDKASHYMVKALGNEPEFVSFFGKKGVPIAANLQGKMSPKLISIADKTKNAYKGIWGKLTADPKKWGRIEKSLENKGYKIGGKVEDFHPHSGEFNRYYKTALRGGNGIEYRRYLHEDVLKRVGPHEIKRELGMFANADELLMAEQAGVIPMGFNAKVMQPIMNRWTQQAAATTGKIWDDVSRLGLSTAEEQSEFIARMTSYYTKGAGKNLNFVARLGSPKRARETLGAMASSLQNAKVGGTVPQELTEIGKVLAIPGQYSLDPWKTAQRYVNSVATDYAYHGLGNSDKMQKIISTPGIFKGEPHVESYLLDNLMPHVLGHKSWPQMQRSLSDGIRKDKILSWLKNHPMVEQTLGADKNKVLIDYFSKSGSLSQEAIGGQVANWFHISTLGLNLSATSANSMQTFITTMNNVGAKGIYRGLHGFAGEEGLLQKVPKYFNALRKGIKPNDAFKVAFPEFVAEQGDWSKTASRLLSGDVAASGMPKLFKAKGVWDKVKGAMMTPFSGTEAGNQLLSFYSGRNQHLFENAAKLTSAGTRAAVQANASKAGGSLALLTQFAGGPLGIPTGIMNMNPMWRQYMHFPMRFMSYLHGSLRMGVDPSKLDWGTIGRVMSGSTAMYIAGRNLLGMDLSRGLVAGAMPIPGYEKAPFYPFPFVPPAASILGEAGKALLTGDTRQLGATGAMLVPGGTALRRAYVNLTPRYASYNDRTPDGRIPLYNRDKSLVGTLSPMELTLKAIGLRPQSVSAEVGAAKWLVSQRDRIRGYRRNFTQALFENDAREAEKINREFQKVYPELGPLKIKKTDIKALENRREIARLQRIEKGISKAYRPLFSQVIGEASLGQMTTGVPMENLGGLQQFMPQQ